MSESEVLCRVSDWGQEEEVASHSGLRFGKRRAHQQVVGKSEEGHSTCNSECCCVIETASFHVIRYQPALEGPENQTVHLYMGAHV